MGYMNKETGEGKTVINFADMIDSKDTESIVIADKTFL